MEIFSGNQLWNIGTRKIFGYHVSILKAELSNAWNFKNCLTQYNSLTNYFKMKCFNVIIIIKLLSTYAYGLIDAAAAAVPPVALAAATAAAVAAAAATCWWWVVWTGFGTWVDADWLGADDRGCWDGAPVGCWTKVDPFEGNCVVT